MLALLIEDVTLVKQRDVTAAVRFRGGATTTLTLPRPLTAQQSLRKPPVPRICLFLTLERRTFCGSLLMMVTPIQVVGHSSVGSGGRGGSRRVPLRRRAAPGRRS